MVIKLTPEVMADARFLLSFPGLLLAATAIGPAFGFITGSIMQRFYVDFDKVSKGDRKHCCVDQRMDKNVSTEVEFISNSFPRKKGGSAVNSCFTTDSFPEKFQRETT